MAKVQGECDPKFEEVRSIFQKLLDSGEELGASVAVNIDGRNVVDLWGGYADEAKTKPWEKDTIVNLYSTSKTITNLATLMLVDRGLLDVNEKVSKYWPEFAQNGKENIEVRHIMSHTSGLPSWDEPISPEYAVDQFIASSRLAKQAPWWEPGTASGYHAWTQGTLLGELVRRVSGKTLKQFVEEEIAGPLNANFQIGAKEADWGRVSPLVPPPKNVVPDGLDPKSMTMRVFRTPFSDERINAEYSRTATWKLGEQGATNGHGNAQGVARILSAITLGGEVDGVRLLSPETIDLIFQEQAYGADLVATVPVRFGIGFGLVGNGDTLMDSILPKGRVCFWTGWGGSVAIMDLDRRMTIAYAMNKMDGVGFGNDAARAHVGAVYKALGVEINPA